MPKIIPEEAWDDYRYFRSIGWSKKAAARKAGFSYRSAIAFENGDPTCAGVQLFYRRRAEAERERLKKEAS